MGRNRNHEMDITETTDRAHKQMMQIKNWISPREGRKQSENHPIGRTQIHWRIKETLLKWLKERWIRTKDHKKQASGELIVEWSWHGLTPFILGEKTKRNDKDGDNPIGTDKSEE